MGGGSRIRESALECISSFSTNLLLSNAYYRLISRTADYALPIPTYFFEPGGSKLLVEKLADKEHISEVAEIAPNLIYLGAGGIKTIGNLYISRAS